ncbi:hypothetical protein BS17DRAFT_774513 [Gyrodon lividus]|nr:hypothetical protein BS17DRAFT_774513 [Gyrodon lividus]
MHVRSKVPSSRKHGGMKHREKLVWKDLLAGFTGTITFFFIPPLFNVEAVHTIVHTIPQYSQIGVTTG